MFSIHQILCNTICSKHIHSYKYIWQAIQAKFNLFVRTHVEAEYCERLSKHLRFFKWVHDNNETIAIMLELKQNRRSDALATLHCSQNYISVHSIAPDAIKNVYLSES